MCTHCGELSGCASVIALHTQQGWAHHVSIQGEALAVWVGTSALHGQCKALTLFGTGCEAKCLCHYSRQVWLVGEKTKNLSLQVCLLQ